MVNIIQSCVSCGCVAAHAVLFTVISCGVVSTHNRHRHINRIDSLVTVGHLEGHRCKVAISVGELTCGQIHVRRTGIRSRC